MTWISLPHVNLCLELIIATFPSFLSSLRAQDPTKAFIENLATYRKEGRLTCWLSNAFEIAGFEALGDNTITELEMIELKGDQESSLIDPELAI